MKPPSFDISWGSVTLFRRNHPLMRNALNGANVYSLDNAGNHRYLSRPKENGPLLS